MGSPYRPGLKRLLVILAGVTVAAALLVAGIHEEAQRKAREDVRECTPTPAEVAEHRDLGGRLASSDPFLRAALAHPQFDRIVGVDSARNRIIRVEDCVDDRRKVRWGPWNAWNRLERLERLLGRDQD
jgi:hypothetical protein